MSPLPPERCLMGCLLSASKNCRVMVIRSSAHLAMTICWRKMSCARENSLQSRSLSRRALGEADWELFEDFMTTLESVVWRL